MPLFHFVSLTVSLSSTFVPRPPTSAASDWSPFQRFSRPDIRRSVTRRAEWCSLEQVGLLCFVWRCARLRWVRVRVGVALSSVSVRLAPVPLLFLLLVLLFTGRPAVRWSGCFNEEVRFFASTTTLGCVLLYVSLLFCSVLWCAARCCALTCCSHPCCSVLSFASLLSSAACCSLCCASSVLFRFVSLTDFFSLLPLSGSRASPPSTAAFLTATALEDRVV